MNTTAQKTLLDVCEFIVDCEHKTAPTQAEGYPSIRTPNVGRGRLILDGVNRVSEDTYREWTKRATPKPNDLIIAREAPVGNVAIIRRGQTVCLGQRTLLVRANSKQVHPEFLCYFLLGDYAQGRFHSTATGATVPHLNMRDIRNLPLPQLPPLPTQCRIASVLSAYDDLIENNTRRIAILEEMAQRLYEEWFVQFRFPGHEEAEFTETELGRMPAAWAIAPFVTLAEVMSGGTPKKTESSFWGGAIPFFTPRDAPQSTYALYTADSITEAGLARCNSKLYPKDTVFITARGTVGKVALASQDMAMNQSCYALRAAHGFGQLFLFLATKATVNELRSRSHGAVFDTIIVDTFRQMQVVVPEKAVVQAFEEKVQPLFALVLNLQMRNANLRAQRDLLLPKLISGEIDV